MGEGMLIDLVVIVQAKCLFSGTESWNFFIFKVI